MQIQIQKNEENIGIIKIAGNLDADSVSLFKKETAKIVDEGCHTLILDCTGMAFVDSMGLGALISLLRKVRTLKGDLKVAGLNKEVKTVFEITRLHRLFDVSADLKSAIHQCHS